MKNLTIGFIGNFTPPYSTENDRAWSFHKLGHTVLTMQENLISSDELIGLLPELDLLLYSHTHDPTYVIPGLKEVFAEYLAKGVPTASVHLDRWAWLKREEDVGKEATWFTEYIFMADASPEAVELYEKHKLNWYYLKPAVVERDCYMSPVNLEIPYDIVFVGSKGYHPEYPFRPQLIEFLKQEYGNRFRHYGSDGLGMIRGPELNLVYSNAKVVVGDSCFGGRPNYVSDRYYEVRGRGGFLLHPEIEGVDHIGVGFYRYGDFKDLKKQIDYWLEHEQERESMRLAGFRHVATFETYTNRSRTMLAAIFGN